MSTDNELRAAMRAAMAGFATAVASIGPDQWQLASPCDGWSLHDVVDHVVAGDRFVVRILDGASVADAADGLTGLGADDADVVGTVRTAAEAARRGFEAPLDVVVDHPVGQITARRFLSFRIIDQIGHTWDLASVTGGVVSIDAATIELGAAIATAERDTLNRSLNFATTADDDVDGHDPLTTLLLLMGRTPK